MTLHVNGLNLLNALFTNIYSGGVDVPRLIYGARDNDPAVLAEVAPRYDPRNRSASLMNFAVNCSDDPSTSPDEFKHGDVLPMYTAIALDFAQRYMLLTCPIMNVPRLPDSSDAPVTADIPTLVLNGAIDPATPASNGDLVASHLPDVKEVTFGNGGHIQLSKLCAQSIIAAFLKDPSAQLDTSCVPDKQSFSLPFAATGASPDGNVSLTVTLPPDFIQVDPSSAQWQRPAGTPIFAINVEPAGTTALEALQKGLAKLGISPGEADIKDGPEIAGLPSKHYQGTKTLGDKEYALDAYGTANENGAFTILALEGNPFLLEGWRTLTLPQILESAVVEP
ncbi:MAG: alpha/beta hydrolase [Caldilineae bacterium]|nr:alpha/beta hydrolase [Caldilineae bacterium]